MKAARLERHAGIDTRPLRLGSLPAPEPGPGELLVRVLACGVCHTDLHVVEGELPNRPLPVTPGHQVVGEVAAAGSGSGRLATGSLVGVPWLNRTCGDCAYCLSGAENLCASARFTGYDVDGGFAEYMVVDEAFAHPLPAGTDPISAAPLLCAGAVGYRALSLSAAGEGDTIGLYGFGASAHIVIQVVRHRGMRSFVFTRSPGHRSLAERLGASWTGSAGDEAPAPLDAAIVFAPAGWIVPLALGATRPGGTVVLAGIHMSPIPEMPHSLIWGERVLRSVANSTRHDVSEMLRVAREAGVSAEIQRFPLDSINEALMALKGGEIDGAAVLEMG